MKEILIIFMAFYSAGCSSARTKDELLGSYKENAGRFHSNTFAFTYGLDDYYFGLVTLESEKNVCDFFVGYKNNKQKYFFPAYRLVELRQVYDRDQTVEEKISKALEKIDSFAVEDQKCTSKIAKTQISVAESVATLIVYSPFIIMAIPFMVEPAVKSLQEESILRRVRKLKLGMNLNQVKELLSKKLKARESKYDIDYYLDIGKSRLVMYFKDNKLLAMVYGYHFEEKKNK